MRKNELLLLITVLLIFGAMVVFSLMWKPNPVYTHAYESNVQRAEAYKRASEEAAKARAGQSDGGTGRGTATGAGREAEPEPLGLKESEIEKQRGNRYNTF